MPVDHRRASRSRAYRRLPTGMSARSAKSSEDEMQNLGPSSGLSHSALVISRLRTARRTRTPCARDLVAPSTFSALPEPAIQSDPPLDKMRCAPPPPLSSSSTGAFWCTAARPGSPPGVVHGRRGRWNCNDAPARAASLPAHRSCGPRRPVLWVRRPDQAGRTLSLVVVGDEGISLVRLCRVLANSCPSRRQSDQVAGRRDRFQFHCSHWCSLKSC